MTVWQYRPEVLAALASFGIKPRPYTRPEVARDFLKALYTMEIRFMRAEQQRNPQSGYRDAVVALRDRYIVLTLPVEAWTE